jgi:hypothetical protein
VLALAQLNHCVVFMGGGGLAYSSCLLAVAGINTVAPLSSADSGSILLLSICLSCACGFTDSLQFCEHYQVLGEGEYQESGFIHTCVGTL